MTTPRSKMTRALALVALGATTALLADCGASSPSPPAADMRSSDASTLDQGDAANEAPSGDDAALPDSLTDARASDAAEASAVDTAADAAVDSSDVIGKVVVGYQGWFDAVGDGSPANVWWHYDSNTQHPPSVADNQLKGWPDMTEFTSTYQSGFANLGNGMPATLFSSYSAQTVDTHVKWMQENGIDTAALQRFSDYTSTRNAVAVNLKNASEKYGRKFYIMYDISGWTAFETALPSDWANVIVGQLKLTSSTAYAKQNGKPVVSLWGCGFSDRPGTVASCTNVINFLKGQGLYVIGGVPRDWRTSSTPFLGVYDLYDMISPWMIGVIGDSGGSDSMRTSTNAPDLAYCNAHHIEYQPCVLPGDLSVKQRAHGDFMWHQFANMIQMGARALYISMYDEFGEGNQIVKTAPTKAWIPTDSSFLTLDEDGTACSSDYYLRLTGDGGKMLKGQIPLTFTRPTPTM